MYARFTLKVAMPAVMLYINCNKVTRLLAHPRAQQLFMLCFMYLSVIMKKTSVVHRSEPVHVLVCYKGSLIALNSLAQTESE